MKKDERHYAFIVAPASAAATPHVRRFSIHPILLKCLLVAGVALIGSAAYGLYSLAQRVRVARVARENNKLREENALQRQQLNLLKNRVEAVESASRRLAEMSGIEGAADSSATKQPRQTPGAGGPQMTLDTASIAEVEKTARSLERNLIFYEAALRERAAIPSLWPATGEVSDSFGGRRDPFGGGASEFHSGQDISAPAGTPVIAPGTATVASANYQNGYGSIIVLDHGGGLTTRYAHLSKIHVGVGQVVERGQHIGDVGSTGRSTGPHLHYEVRLNEIAVNPRRYLPSE